jgi:hypothetical protein
MESETLEEEQSIPNVRTGCICSNGGWPVDGWIYIEPACRVHYAESGIPQAEHEARITKVQLAEWAELGFKRRKRHVTTPKMPVARS